MVISTEVLHEKIKHVHEDVLETKDLVRAQNTRIRKLENWRNVLIGGFTVIAFIIGKMWR